MSVGNAERLAGKRRRFDFNVQRLAGKGARLETNA
jgi:hypothetical protein